MSSAFRRFLKNRPAGVRTQDRRGRFRSPHNQPLPQKAAAECCKTRHSRRSNYRRDFAPKRCIQIHRSQLLGKSGLEAGT